MVDPTPALTAEDAATLERCIGVGGIACVPTDTVYGLACDPTDPVALERLWALKGRNPNKPSAVLFSRVELALAATPWLDDELAEAITRILPGPVTVIVPNPEQRYHLVCGDHPEVLGLRVPHWPDSAEVLRQTSWPLMQTSANHPGRPDPASLEEVDPVLAAGCDLLLNAGTLPGTPSSVVDLTRYAAEGTWNLLREGAVDRKALARKLDH